MKQRDLVLVLIGLCGDDVQFGRTSLQKMAYLSGALLRQDLGHHAYFYGPYSASVEGHVEALWLSDLIEERKRRLGVNASGFEIARYEYSLTPAGRDRFEQVASTYVSEVAQLKEFISFLKDKAGSLHQSILSAVAKVHFIETMENEKLSPEQVRELARNLGWPLSKGQIERVQEVSREIQGFTAEIA